MRRESEGSSEVNTALASCFPFRCFLGFTKVSDLFFGVGGLGTGFRLVDGEELDILRFFFCVFLLISAGPEASGLTSFNVATSFSKLISADSSSVDRGEGRFLFLDDCSVTGAVFIVQPGT